MQKELLFEFETHQKGATYHVRVIKMGAFFCLERTDLADWLALIQDAPCYICKDRVIHVQTDMETLLREQIANHRLYRAFRWQEADNLYVAWRGCEQKIFYARKGEMVRFESQTEWHKSPFWTCEGAYFRQQFEEEWKNPSSDVHDALAFLKAPPNARQRWAVTWTRGSWTEVESVLGAALQLEFSGDAQLTQHANTHLILKWKIYPWKSPSERLQRLLKIIDERNVHSLPAHGARERGGHTVEITISSPAMHEKIEARFFLLNWLTQHAPHLLEDWN